MLVFGLIHLFSTRGNFPLFLPGTFANVWRYFGLLGLEGSCATDTYWIEANDIEGPLIVHRAALQQRIIHFKTSVGSR